MNARAHWMVTVLAGIGVIVIGLTILPKFPSEGAGYEPGYGDPVYAFEMAQSLSDLQAVFGMPDDPARETRIAAMNDGTKWDFLFLIVYGAFISSFFLSIRNDAQRVQWIALAFLGAVAASADAVENLILLGLTEDLEQARHLEFLPYPVWVKFFSIMVAGFAVGFYLMGKRHWISSLFGGAVMLGAATVLLAFFDGARFGWMVGGGITICWVVQFGYALWRLLGKQSKDNPNITSD